MKKIFCCLLCLMILFCCTACTGQDLINDKNTGEVYTGTPSEFRDGSYTVTATYYNADGYKPCLRIDVHNGILTKAEFTETNAAGGSRTEAPEDYPKTLDTLYNTLISKLIRKQDKTKDIVEGAETISEQFNLLTKTAVKLAQTGDQESDTVILPDTYSITQTWEDNTTSTLIVTFDETDTITDCSYSNVDATDALTESKMIFQIMTDNTTEANDLEPVQLDDDVILTEALSLEHYNNTLALLAAFRNNGY